MKELEIAYQLKKCNDSFRRLYKEDYDGIAKPYSEILTNYSKSHNLPILEGVLGICEQLKEEPRTIAWFMSVAYDLINNKKLSK